jgi:hypothetical protein
MKYKDWDLLESLPDGWKIDKSCGSPLNGYSFATNGKSILNGGVRVLVKVERKPVNYEYLKPEVIRNENSGEKQEVVIDENYVRTVNDLARKKFEQRLLSDLMIDLTICEIEGWCKMEYIRELRRLLASIARRKSISIPISGSVEQIAFEF